MSLALLLAAASLSGCDEPGAARRPAASPTPDVQRSARAAPDPPSSVALSICDDAGGALPTLQAIAALGEPVEQARFTLRTPLTEFRIKLLNQFQLSRDAGTMIWEQTWSSGNCRLTIWSASQNAIWQPVEWLHWSAGDQF